MPGPSWGYFKFVFVSNYAAKYEDLASAQISLRISTEGWE